MSTVGYATLQIIPSLRGLSGKLGEELGGLDQSAEKAGTSAGGKLSGALGKVLKASVVAVGAAAGGALGTALFKGWNRLTAIENATAKLTGLGHSAASVKSIMDNALASVKGTAFGLDEAASVSAMAVAAGIKPGKQLEGVLKTVADTATIAGASMGDMGLIFGSVAARGKLQGDDLMQLQARGVPVLQFLAKHYGVTAQAASEMVSKGKVDFANFNAAMQKNLGGAALKSGETTKGAFANTGAAMGRFGAALLTGVFPIAKIVFGAVTQWADKATEAVKPLGAALGKFFLDVDGPVQQFVAGFTLSRDEAGKLGSELTGLVAVGVKVRDFVTSVTDKISEFVSGFQMTRGEVKQLDGPLNGLTASGFRLKVTIDQVVQAVKDFISGWKLGDKVKDLDGMAAAGQKAKDVFGDSWDKIKDIFGKLSEAAIALAPAVGDIATSLSKASASIGISTWKLLLITVDALAKVAGTVLVPAIQALAGWMSKHQTTVTVLVGAYTGYKVAMVGVQTVTKATAAVTAAYRAVTVGMTAASYGAAGATYAQGAALKVYTVITKATQIATKAWAAATWLLNTALSANPIGLIVIGIAALVAGIVIAYKKSDTFRAIVDKAFRAVGAAGKWLWENGIKPAFDGVKKAFDAVGAAAMWLYSNGIKPAFDFIAGIISWWYSNVVSPVFSTVTRIITSFAALWWWLAKQEIGLAVDAIKAAISALGAAATWLWEKAISPAVDAIAAAAMWLWRNAIVPAFDGAKAAVSALGAAAMWLWSNAISPAFNAISSAATWLWRNVLVPAFDGITSAAKWLYSNGIQPAFSAIGSVFSWLWSTAKSNFDRILSILGTVRDTFRSVFSAIGGFVSNAFNGAVGTVRSAINGLISLVNKAAGFINGNVIDKLNKVPGVNFPHVPTIPSLAEGGIIPATPGGRIVRVAEAGQAEAVVPLDRLRGMLRGRGGDDRPPVTQNFYVQNVDESAVAMMSARRLAAVGVR